MNADRVAVTMVAIALLTGCSAPSMQASTPAPSATPCPAQNERYCAADTGDLLDVRLGDL